ncbi:CATRA system-associated protein [Amycolatopsis australiensis]|uniref:CobQ/CobB/MinD/ParA nucleotide binding domain-containing protein n=1 Tax=Amycolatopsis australiensis TaxID=546364 RepID=A0A1K1QUE3_9PSEU|nr:CATRA system-associated protein [Amycolatopsis australiensis]SFW63381.1 CobQ/CobB/MinD/ParA nucleotide binding domain-containing protein [Amycolatopsis australiensis]
MTGTVVTFYSYKGGVGRSFTLANIAVLLARWGHRVLAVDWDLEAPGLHHYFRPLLSRPPRGGVVDLADDFLACGNPHDHAIPLDLAVDGSVALLAAGRDDADYTRRVQSLDWEDLYRRGFAEFLERRREEWTENYDFVLIDSRTGISDSGGICTAHLPDWLVVLFTANQQSVDGVVDIARRADAARDRLPYDRQPHLVLPILSRLDNRVEYERAEAWQERCAEATASLFRNWLDKSVSQEQMLRHTTVPYVSYWSFGEQLPVLEEPSPSADQVSFSLETVAAVLAHQFDRTALLADNRDAYVAAARSHRQSYDLDLLVSSPRPAQRIANQLIEELKTLGLRVDRSLSGDPEFLEQSSDPAEHLCLIVDGVVSRWQASEAERFLRHALDTGGRQLFCVLTGRTDREQLPPFLQNLRLFVLDAASRPRQVARQLHEIVTDGPPNRTDADQAVLQDAAAALRGVPEELTHQGRWAIVEQTVRDMTAALDQGDVALLKDLTVDLELLNDVRANGSRFAAPAGLRAYIDALINRLHRRIEAYTN